LFSEEPEQCEHHEKVAYYWPVFLVLVTIIDVIMMGVEIAVNHGFEPFSVNPFFGPSGTINNFLLITPSILRNSLD